MIPCKICNPKIEAGRIGLKQKGRTKRDGSIGVRLYVCQDCGAVSKLTFDTSTKTFREEPVFSVVV